MIKMVNEFKLTVVHFARPNPMQICACAWIYRWTEKTVENEEWATVSPGLRTAGPPGRRGPWAAGRWAFGPPGCWAVAGLLLAKPCFTCLLFPNTMRALKFDILSNFQLELFFEKLAFQQKIREKQK